MTSPAQRIPPRTGGRVESLDGLRGIAAIIVVLGHSEAVFAREALESAAIHQSAAALLLNASGAIHLFFVLSGYVLAGSAGRGQGRSGLSQFFVRRVFRIHPPYLAALLFAWLLTYIHSTLPEGGDFSSWILEFHAIQLGGLELFLSSLFPGDAFGQLPVGWTLRVEMIFSLLLPALLWAARQSRVGLLLLSLGLLPFDYWTASYTLDFAVGIVLFLERERAALLLARLPTWGRLAFGVLGLAVLTYPEYALLEFESRRAAFVLYALGSGMVVLAAAHLERLRGWLSTWPCQAVGRISYSTYLLHLPIILLCLPWAREVGEGRWSWLPFALVMVCLTCALSWVSYRVIEAPAIRVGNHVCAWLGQRLGEAPLESRWLDRGGFKGDS